MYRRNFLSMASAFFAGLFVKPAKAEEKDYGSVTLGRWSHQGGFSDDQERIKVQGEVGESFLIYNPCFSVPDGHTSEGFWVEDKAGIRVMMDVTHWHPTETKQWKMRQPFRGSLVGFVLAFCLLIPSFASAGQFSSLAAGIIAIHSQAKVVVIPPKPITPVTNDCDNCGGSGRLGDGTVSTKCPVCDGSGKKPVPKAPTVIPKASQGKWVTSCSGGQCTQTWVPATQQTQPARRYRIRR